MIDITTLTEADILGEVVNPEQPWLNAEAAQSILGLTFSDRARKQMRDLLDRNNQGTTTDEELELLERYRRVGLFLDVIQARARQSLKELQAT
jgi:prophage antirepressor-like protein